jgi:alginate O-acetyltransferase complex protein AlgI
VVGVALNLCLLLLFKYSPLFTRIFPRSATTSLGHFLTTIPLPIGISFFTFQGISLVVEVFRDQQSSARSAPRVVPRNFIDHLQNTALFKSFFPYLIAGPIVKAHEFYPQIGAKQFKNIPWETAFRCLVIGYFLKMVVADNLKDATFWIEYPHFLRHSSFALLALLFGYSMQIFADFAGYSLIALGLGHLFGYALPTNFNFPYLSRSFSEFWKRWHISLSTWLRDYLYIPLGGNRVGPARRYVNLVTVFFLCGLWHGASWNFVIWGLWHGTFLVIERVLFYRGDRKARREQNSSAVSAGSAVPSGVVAWPLWPHVYTMAIVMIGWVFFRAETLTGAIAFLTSLAGMTAATPTPYTIWWYLTPELWLALAAGAIGSTPWVPALAARIDDGRGWGMPLLNTAALLTLLLLSIMSMAARTYNPFIYFRF